MKAKTKSQQTSDAWKKLYLQAKAEIENLQAENESLRSELDDSNKKLLVLIQWNRPIGF